MLNQYTSWCQDLRPPPEPEYCAEDESSELSREPGLGETIGAFHEFKRPTSYGCVNEKGKVPNPMVNHGFIIIVCSQDGFDMRYTVAYFQTCLLGGRFNSVSRLNNVYTFLARKMRSGGYRIIVLAWVTKHGYSSINAQTYLFQLYKETSQNHGFLPSISNIVLGGPAMTWAVTGASVGCRGLY